MSKKMQRLKRSFSKAKKSLKSKRTRRANKRRNKNRRSKRTRLMGGAAAENWATAEAEPPSKMTPGQGIWNWKYSPFPEAAEAEAEPPREKETAGMDSSLQRQIREQDERYANLMARMAIRAEKDAKLKRDVEASQRAEREGR